jgi:quercetin dioxygenase-like cupin family protein
MSVTRHRLAADAVLQIMWQADSRRENVMTTAVSNDSTVQDRVIVLTSAEDSAGEVFRFEYVACQVTPPPRDHIHTEQEELLEVLEGTVRCRVAGIDHLLRHGQRMIIPPGTPHAVWNDDPRGSRSIGEFRPAMNAERIFRPFIVDTVSTR